MYAVAILENLLFFRGGEGEGYNIWPKTSLSYNETLGRVLIYIFMGGEGRFPGPLRSAIDMYARVYTFIEQTLHTYL